ncbi:hypothetical protein GA0070619_6367 [Micromonospora zamorensis]
MADHQ